MMSTVSTHSNMTRIKKKYNDQENVVMNRQQKVSNKINSKRSSLEKGKKIKVKVNKQKPSEPRENSNNINIRRNYGSNDSIANKAPQQKKYPQMVGSGEVSAKKNINLAN